MESTVIHMTENGQIFICNECDKFHFEFGNIVLTFSEEHLRQFAEWILELDGEHWEAVCSDSVYRRKIQVPVGGCHLRMALTLEELGEVKKLLWRVLMEHRIGAHKVKTVISIN
jgi:hypothetical protein